MDTHEWSGPGKYSTVRAGGQQRRAVPDFDSSEGQRENFHSLQQLTKTSRSQQWPRLSTRRTCCFSQTSFSFFVYALVQGYQNKISSSMHPPVQRTPQRTSLSDPRLLHESICSKPCPSFARDIDLGYLRYNAPSGQESEMAIVDIIGGACQYPLVVRASRLFETKTHRGPLARP